MESFSNINLIGYRQTTGQFETTINQAHPAHLVDNIYDKARISTDKELIFEVLASALFAHFDAFDRDQLQEVFVILMTSQKERGDSSINPYQDVQITVEKLKNHFACTSEFTYAITQLQEEDPDFFHLEKGIARYNLNQKSFHQNVTITLQILDLPLDLHTLLIQPLSFIDVISCSLTCQHQQQIVGMLKLTSAGKAKITDQRSAKDIFGTYPEYRSDRFLPIDQKGIDYLQQKLGLNCGPLTIQKIKDGKLTIPQAKKEMEIESAAFYKDAFESNLVSYEVEALKKYLIDGSLKGEQVPHHQQFFACYIADKTIQKYLDNGKLTMKYCREHFYDWQRTTRGLDLKQLLQYKEIQQYLDNGKLAIQQLIEIMNAKKSEYFIEALCQKEIEQSLDTGILNMNQLIIYSRNAEIRGLTIALGYQEVKEVLYNGKLTIDRLVKIGARNFAIALRNEHIQKYLTEKKLPIEWLINFSDSEALAESAMEKMIQKFLDNGKLTLGQIIKLLEDFNAGQLKFLEDPNWWFKGSIIALLEWILDQAQKYLDNDKLTTDQILSTPNPFDFANSLHDGEQLQLYLDDNTLAIEQLLPLRGIRIFSCVLDYEEIKNSLDKGELRLDWLIKQWNHNATNTLAFANVLKNKKVRDYLEQRFSWEELVNLPQIAPLYTILSDKRIHRCLGSSYTLDELIVHPHIDAVAYVLALPNTVFQQHLDQNLIKTLIELDEIRSFAYILRIIKEKNVLDLLCTDDDWPYRKLYVETLFELLPNRVKFAACLKKCEALLTKSSLLGLIKYSKHEDVLPLISLCSDKHFQKCLDKETRVRLSDSFKKDGSLGDSLQTVLSKTQFDQYLSEDYWEMQEVVLILQIPQYQNYFETDMLTVPVLLATSSVREALLNNDVQRCLALEEITIEQILTSTKSDLILLAKNGLASYVQTLFDKNYVEAAEVTKNAQAHERKDNNCIIS
ncbi:MAG: hypothetical protein K0R08_1781 [Solimicrobium sp.]|jgi:hypothetical protein|nr:hypothetical protein [Solimicrobium sp.]